ncbi:MAG: uroporphyrinogen-III C-methyltransferase [Cohaesibacter sp.]|jgi:uroporphyrin-III C-methyltransferase|nr:uroporphyrinogen-III C-methyltransferase [Cohaesibacter sp.]
MTLVSFVSSGPGDPELLTLKAVNRLQNADVILYDDLSAGDILSHANPEADLVSVGKRAGRPSPKQDHINKLLVDYAKHGGKIVRLKSGDAGIFGRLEEEVTCLHEAGFEYEIIPGITAASAAAASFGIPLTRRLVARRLQFITGHDVTGKLPEQLNLAALSDEEVITVVYMGKRTFAKLATLLLEHGMSPDTPALLAKGISTPEEKIEETTVSVLQQSLPNDTDTTPTLIIYGPLLSHARED